MSDLIDWERQRPRVVYAQIYQPGDPGQVLIAEDEESIGQAIALHVIARTPPREVGSSAGEIRSALLERRWADAVVAWMGATGHVVDCYPDEPVWGSAPADRPVEFELQFTPLFEETGA